MKSGDKLQLSAAWWKKNKAITAPDGGLEKLLKTYESEAKVYLANPSVDGYAKTLEALKKVEQAAKSVADQCKSVVNRSTREALEKNEVIGQTRKELQGKQDDYAKRLKHFTEGGEALAKKIELAVQRLAELLSSAKQVASQGEGDRDAKEIEELQQSADKVYGELEEDLHELQQIAKTGTGLHPQDASAASSRIGAALKAGIKAVGDVKKLLADLPKLLPEEHRVARFQLTARWWRDNRGATPDGGLEDALKEYEVWLKKVAGAATTQNYPQLLHALDEVESTAKAVLAKLGNAQGELATALRGAPAVIKSARDPIDKAHRAYVEKVAAYTRKQA
ncbi:MAG: hypothetical protein JNM56_01615, partial [Planctomycetia bacterium]|nr:hypothetical protein [Planctomycetia bacterium]